MGNRSRRVLGEGLTEEGYSNRALLICTLQNDYCHPDGRLYVKGAEALAMQISEHILAQREIHNPYGVVAVVNNWFMSPNSYFSQAPDFYNYWPEHCKANTWGAEIPMGLDRQLIDYTFLLPRFEAPFDYWSAKLNPCTHIDPTLDDVLLQNGISLIDIVGAGIDSVVFETCRVADRYGYHPRILTRLYKSRMTDLEFASDLVHLAKDGIKVDF